MRNSKNKNFVYHYCSPEKFLSIIENKSIQLTDINKMNDCMEKKWVADYLLTHIDQLLKEKGLQISLEQEYKYNEKSTTHGAFFKNLVNDFVNHATPVLVVSFSEIGDSLGLWRGYAAGGTGLSIGFDKDLLEGLEKGNTLFQPAISYREMIYDELKQQEKLEETAKAVIDQLFWEFENTPMGKSYYSFESYFFDEFDSFCNTLIRIICFDACFIKNPAFQEEAETRIACIPNTTAGIRKEKFILSPIKNQLRGNRLTTFSEFSFEELMEEGIIGHVVIGPNSEISPADLNGLFEANGYPSGFIKIEKSAATHRCNG